MLGSRTALSVALFAGMLLALSFVFAGWAGEDEVHRVVAVRHSGVVEAPGYSRTMIASYYHSSLEGLETAGGEMFDPQGYTAAHRTLPLGTRLRVSYRGEPVRVTVNDRGPYKQGRVIDLSEAAAKQLDIKDKGVAQVKIEVVEETPQNSTVSTASVTK